MPQGQGRLQTPPTPLCTCVAKTEGQPLVYVCMVLPRFADEYRDVERSDQDLELSGRELRSERDTFHVHIITAKLQ